MEIIVDTLSFRANFPSLENLFEFLGLNYTGMERYFEYSDKQFNRNYLGSLFYEGIKIGLQGQKGWEFYIHMSGKGCRAFEDLHGAGFDWFPLMQRLQNLVEAKFAAVTRIDIACDDMAGYFDIHKLENSIDKDKYLSRCPKTSIRCVKFGEECLYVGSPQSLALLRIYNKKLERGYSPEDNEVPHWWRCEFQLRDEHAAQIVKEWTETGNIGKVYAGHVLKHIRFLTKPNMRDGTQHRINTAPWWKKFLEDSDKLEWVSSKGSEYNLSKVQRYAVDNAGSSILTMIRARNLTAQELFDIYYKGDIHLRPDQRALIKKYEEAHND